MSERNSYPSGVPCWVETFVPDPQAALTFYGSIFGWDFAGPGEVPGNPPGHYFVARVRGRDVAGIGSLPDPTIPLAWVTHIRVGSADEAAEKTKRAGGAVHEPPFDAPPAGRLAVLSDPSGAVFCAWESGTREGAQLVNEANAWAMSTLRTTDVESSKAFYRDVFGWEAQAFGPPDAQLSLWRRPGYFGGEPQQPVPRDVVGAMQALGANGSAQKQKSHWSVDFWVSDADAAAEKAAQLGGAVIVPPHDAPPFRHAVLADPQGPIFSISELRIGR